MGYKPSFLGCPGYPWLNVTGSPGSPAGITLQDPVGLEVLQEILMEAVDGSCEPEDFFFGITGGSYPRKRWPIYLSICIPYGPYVSVCQYVMLEKNAS